jgi:hypothetical protein
MRIDLDMTIESCNLIMGGTPEEAEAFICESVANLSARDIEITARTHNTVSYRMTVGEALAKGFSREAVASMAFARVYQERRTLYHSGEADFFTDEAAVYRALDAQLPH